MSDARDCADIVDGRKPPQFDDARRYYEQVSKMGFNNISITGHSLGGACAAYLASQYSVSVTTFNAPGIGAIVSSARGSIKEPYGLCTE